MGDVLLCYHSIAPCTSKGDISTSAICHLWRFILIDWYVGLNILNFGILVVFAIALLSICCVRFTANDSEVDDYCLQFHLGRRKCPRCRRLPTVPKLFSIIIIANF